MLLCVLIHHVSLPLSPLFPNSEGFLISSKDRERTKVKDSVHDYDVMLS